MYRGYKIVVNTAAGRRRYMQYLVPAILACDIVDRYDVWVNTLNGTDIEFFRRLAAEFPKVNLVWQPDGVVDGIRSINAFYKACVEEDAIYFKIDDVLIWIEPDGIRKMVDFRIDNPEYFLVSPIVINNPVAAYLLQVRGKLKLDRYFNCHVLHPIMWKDGNFVLQLHEWFMDTCLATRSWDKLHTKDQPMSMARFSINAVLWFGRDLKKIDGIVPGDDEEFLSCIHPTQIGAANCWNGSVVAAHFAFFTQRDFLDSQNILERYGKIIFRLAEGTPVEPVNRKVQEILRYVNANDSRLVNDHGPYAVLPKAEEKKPGLIRILGSKAKSVLRKAGLIPDRRIPPEYILR